MLQLNLNQPENKNKNNQSYSQSQSNAGAGTQTTGAASNRRSTNQSSSGQNSPQSQLQSQTGSSAPSSSGGSAGGSQQGTNLKSRPRFRFNATRTSLHLRSNDPKRSLFRIAEQIERKKVEAALIARDPDTEDAIYSDEMVEAVERLDQLVKQAGYGGIIKMPSDPQGAVDAWFKGKSVLSPGGEFLMSDAAEERLRIQAERKQNQRYSGVALSNTEIAIQQLAENLRLAGDPNAEENARKTVYQTRLDLQRAAEASIPKHRYKDQNKMRIGMEDLLEYDAQKTINSRIMNANIQKEVVRALQDQAKIRSDIEQNAIAAEVSAKLAGELSEIVEREMYRKRNGTITGAALEISNHLRLNDARIKSTIYRTILDSGLKQGIVMDLKDAQELTEDVVNRMRSGELAEYRDVKYESGLMDVQTYSCGRKGTVKSIKSSYCPTPTESGVAGVIRGKKRNPIQRYADARAQKAYGRIEDAPMDVRELAEDVRREQWSMAEQDRLQSLFEEVGANPIGYLTTGPFPINYATFEIATEIIPGGRLAKDTVQAVVDRLQGKQLKQYTNVANFPMQALVEPVMKQALWNLWSAPGATGYMDQKGRWHPAPTVWMYQFTDYAAKHLGKRYLEFYDKNKWEFNRLGKFNKRLANYFEKKKNKNEQIGALSLIVNGVVMSVGGAIMEVAWDVTKKVPLIGKGAQAIEDFVKRSNFRNGITEAWNHGGGWAALDDEVKAAKYLDKAEISIKNISSRLSAESGTKLLDNYASWADGKMSSVSMMGKLEAQIQALGGNKFVALNILGDMNELSRQVYLNSNFESLGTFSKTMYSTSGQAIFEEWHMGKITGVETVERFLKLDPDFFKNFEDWCGKNGWDVFGDVTKSIRADLSGWQNVQKFIGKSLDGLSGIKTALLPDGMASVVRGASTGVSAGFFATVVTGNPLFGLGVGVGSGFLHSISAMRGVLTGAGLYVAFGSSPVAWIGGGVVGMSDILRKQFFELDNAGHLIERVTQRSIAVRLIERVFPSGFVDGVKNFARFGEVVPTTGLALTGGLIFLGFTNPLLLAAPVAIDGGIRFVRMMSQNQWGWWAHDGWITRSQQWLSEFFTTGKLGFISKALSRVNVIFDVGAGLYTSEETGGLFTFLKNAFADALGGRMGFFEWLLKHGGGILGYGGTFLGLTAAFGPWGAGAALIGFTADQVLIWSTGQGLWSWVIQPTINWVWNNWLSGWFNPNALAEAAAGALSFLTGLVNVALSLSRGQYFQAAVSLGFMIAGGMLVYNSMEFSSTIAAQYTPVDEYVVDYDNSGFVLAADSGLKKTLQQSGGKNLNYTITYELAEGETATVNIVDTLSGLTASNVSSVSGDFTKTTNPNPLTYSLEGSSKSTLQLKLTLKQDLNQVIGSTGQLCNSVTAIATSTKTNKTQNMTYSLCSDAFGNVKQEAYGLQIKCENCVCPLTGALSCAQGPFGKASHCYETGLPLDLAYEPAGTSSGKPVIAPIKGTVKRNIPAYCKSGGQRIRTGNTLEIDGENGLTYQFVHVNSNLTKGEAVTQGQLVATIAPDDACIDGSHLHLNVLNSQGYYVDALTNLGEKCGLDRDSCSTDGGEEGMKCPGPRS